jgi:O-methyltransferase involved in polyketide biosynthesis
MNKIALTEEKETLLIPLYGKAKENEKEDPILLDKKAAEIINQIDYNFQSLKIQNKTNIMMCLRAKLMDDYVKEFLSKNDDCVALHLGCGLDSRYDRIKNSSVDWYDVDFEEVIELRRFFYKQTDRYHLIASCVTENQWIDKIPQNHASYIVIAEGLLMYLKEEEIKTLINRLRDRIGRFTLIFDAYSTLTAKKAKNHPSLKKTGAKIYWGIDDTDQLMKWGATIRFIEEKYFTSSKDLVKLDFITRLIFKMAGLFTIANKAHRILICEVDQK